MMDAAEVTPIRPTLTDQLLSILFAAIRPGVWTDPRQQRELLRFLSKPKQYLNAQYPAEIRDVTKPEESLGDFEGFIRSTAALSRDPDLGYLSSCIQPWISINQEVLKNTPGESSEVNILKGQMRMALLEALSTEAVLVIQVIQQFKKFFKNNPREEALLCAEIAKASDLKMLIAQLTHYSTVGYTLRGLVESDSDFYLTEANQKLLYEEMVGILQGLHRLTKTSLSTTCCFDALERHLGIDLPQERFDRNVSAAPPIPEATTEVATPEPIASSPLPMVSEHLTVINAALEACIKSDSEEKDTESVRTVESSYSAEARALEATSIPLVLQAIARCRFENETAHQVFSTLLLEVCGAREDINVIPYLEQAATLGKLDDEQRAHLVNPFRGKEIQFLRRSLLNYHAALEPLYWANQYPPSIRFVEAICSARNLEDILKNLEGLRYRTSDDHGAVYGDSVGPKTILGKIIAQLKEASRYADAHKACIFKMFQIVAKNTEATIRRSQKPMLPPRLQDMGVGMSTEAGTVSVTTADSGGPGETNSPFAPPPDTRKTPDTSVRPDSGLSLTHHINACTFMLPEKEVKKFQHFVSELQKASVTKDPGQTVACLRRACKITGYDQEYLAKFITNCDNQAEATESLQANLRVHIPAIEPIYWLQHYLNASNGDPSLTEAIKPLKSFRDLIALLQQKILQQPLPALSIFGYTSTTIMLLKKIKEALGKVAEPNQQSALTALQEETKRISLTTTPFAPMSPSSPGPLPEFVGPPARSCLSCFGTLGAVAPHEVTARYTPAFETPGGPTPTGQPTPGLPAGFGTDAQAGAGTAARTAEEALAGHTPH